MTKQPHSTHSANPRERFERWRAADIAPLLELLKNPAPSCRQRQPRQAVPGGLLTAAQAAAWLNCSSKTLNAHVAAGELKYIVIGRGKKRPRRFFKQADLDEFIAAQTRKDSPCPSTASRARRSGITISGGTVIDFTGPRKPPTDAKRKK